MFRIKICGITNVADARVVADSGADAAGLNFYRQSPRYVGLDTARQIVDVLGDDLVKVGLFVNASVEEVCGTFDILGLDLIQVHGDERPDFLAELGPRPVMRAFRLGAGGLGQMLGYLEDCRRLGCTPELALVDACVEGSYGGTGQVADWETLKGYPRSAALPPLVLAGGLTPDNVAAAIQAVRPTAVDTASGVESRPGRKDAAAVEAFVSVARSAFDQQ